MKKIFAVSIVWVKQNSNSLSVYNTLTTNIEADSSEQAFGIAYNRNYESKKDYQLHTRIVAEQSIEDL